MRCRVAHEQIKWARSAHPSIRDGARAREGGAPESMHTEKPDSR